MTTLPALIVTEATSPFDYSTLDSAIAAEARTMADRIRTRIESSHLDTGRDLLTIKAKLDHGQFGKWLNAEFNMSERTAQNLMGLAEYANDKPATVADLPTTAVYKLAAPSTPKVIQEEIEQRVVKGERPSTREIEDRIAKAKDEQAREAAKARKLKGKSEMDAKVIEKREKDRAARERREREEVGRLHAERQKAAQEAMDLLRERLGGDLLRFAHLCKRARGTLALLGEMITNTMPIIAEADPGFIDEAAAEASHGLAEGIVDEVDHGSTEEIVAEAEPGFFDEVVAEEEIVDEVDHSFTEEVIVEADYGFTEEYLDDCIVEDAHAETVAEKAHPKPAELTELDLGEAA